MESLNPYESHRVVKKGANMSIISRLMVSIYMAKLLLTGNFAFSAATIEREYFFMDCLWINFTEKGIPFISISSPERNNAIWRIIAARY